MISVNTMGKLLNEADKIVLSFIIGSITAAIIIALFVCCQTETKNEFPLDLADVVETGYGNTVDGDSMYWAIYEEWSHNCKRHLLYMDKETFDSLELAIEEFHKADVDVRDSLNHLHGFTLLRDSEGLHLCSIR